MAQPVIDYYDHPVFHPKRFHIETPAMKKMHDDLLRVLWTGATGALILGPSRAGKTRAMETLASQLHTRSNDPIPTFYISIPPRDQSTILHVFRQLCYSENLRVTNRDRSDHLSDRFVHYIADKAVEANCPYVILIIDEMQRLQLRQFGAFAELYDKLSLLGITMTVLFVANDQECINLLERIEDPEYAHIRGRFFTQRFYFHGLTSKEQVKYCLLQYDTLRYPVQGPTYTEYFLPEAVKRGWRLASLSREIWRVFYGYKKNLNIDSWGMQYFTSTINTLLIDFLPQHGVEEFDDEMVHECIRISGLIPSLVHPLK